MGDNNTPAEARLDKWLWAARIYKTRTIATAACKNNRVSINGKVAKPSRMVKVGDKVAVKKSPATFTFIVKQAIEKRVGAKLIPEILDNITDASQYELLAMNRIAGVFNRAKGTGRPTKKDRRELDDFTDTSGSLAPYSEEFAYDFDELEDDEYSDAEHNDTEIIDYDDDYYYEDYEEHI